jgi:hypothetical protein
MSDWMKTRTAWVRSNRRFCLHFGACLETFRGRQRQMRLFERFACAARKPTYEALHV